MQLRLAGGSAGTLWENRTLDGRLPSSFGDWLNFGGDKSWPAPQCDWPRHQGRDWPPPAAFDASPMEAVTADSNLTLTSPIDLHWGIQVVRSLELDPVQPVLRIRTEFRKLLGYPVRVAIWTITQFQEPDLVAILLPEPSTFAHGYTRLLDAEPAGLTHNGRLLSFIRHPLKFVKIGSDASTLVWVGPASVVRMDAESGPGDYPDGGCVTQVYTNPGPLAYVELEALGPLATLVPGATIERTTTYTVLPRTTPDPLAEAQAAF
jgi:hypothetical protein